MNKATSLFTAGIVAVGTLVSSSVMAGGYYAQPEYQVTVTNITKGQAFTPILTTTHKSSMDLFDVGEMASMELIDVAESGNVMPLKTILDASGQVKDVAVSEGLLMAGNTVSYSITGGKRNRLSLVAMLIPTNDTFVGLDGVNLPRWGSKTYLAYAHDAGSEMNDELCSNIPGPVCGGAGLSPEDDGEGYIYPSAGVHGEADLSVANYDWQGAVAKITITRTK